MSDPTSFRENYLGALSLPEAEVGKNLPASDSKDKPNRKRESLDRAHELRKFEIENYWKRATYFWAFQVTAFALFGLIWKDVAKLDRLALLLPAGLGAISAQVGWLTAKGSKFWQENWEAHVDLLEGEVEGRMTQTILSKTGPQYSVSRVNQNFMFLLMIGWVGAFVIILFEPLEERLRPFAQWLALAALTIAMVWLPAWSRTRLTGWRYREGQRHWQRSESVSLRDRLSTALELTFRLAPKKPEIVLRDPLSSRPEPPQVEK